MSPESDASLYSDEFFEWDEEGAVESARLIVPIVLDLLEPTSVLDVGCGRGAWLRVFKELGVGAIQGLDGAYVNRSRLLVPQECFACADLSQPFDVPGRYDLAVCLEVAEHLPAAMAPVLIDKLVEAAPAVLFSAALPGQGGVHHVNLMMPDYWRAMFRRHGYTLLDPIRPRILTDTRIKWWYRQNTVLYVSENIMRTSPDLVAFRMPEDGLGIEWVRANLLGRQQDVRSLSRQLAWAVGRAFRRRAVDGLARVFGRHSNPRA